ncbi:MAG: methyltransferase domain-containing protein [Deltaproteobacteria bacterium]|nr:methyltransferase domain-containing protein [Deltaproteobacteria bacterium]
MHPAVFQAFDRICRARGAGGAVLEIGATPTPDTLLCLPALAGAREKLGVNLDGPHQCAGFTIARGDARQLELPAARFDTILCNSVLEHDPHFWRTLAEMRRVARPGALLVIGVPAYGVPPRRRLLRGLRRLPLLGPRVESALASTPTLLPHQFPGDYYRFSAQAMREVLLEGLDAVEVDSILSPPRVIGSGVVPG